MKIAIIVAATAMAVQLNACTALTAPIDTKELNTTEGVDGANAAASEAATDDSTEIVPEAPGGVLEGIVRRDHSNEPIANATVVIHGTELSAITDKEGKFRIVGLQGGKHAVVITHKRHIPRATPMVSLPSQGAFLLTAWLRDMPKPVNVSPVGYRCGHIPTPLVIVDGSKISYGPFGSFDISDRSLKSLSLLSQEEAAARYGKEQVYGGALVAETGLE
jgi:hypothetical protein